MRMVLAIVLGLLPAIFLAAALSILARSAPAQNATSLIIPAGHEGEVTALLTPLREHGFAGLTVAGIGVGGDEIRVQLGSANTAGGCEIQGWAKPPGGITIGYHPDQPDRPVAGDSRSGSGVSRGLSVSYLVCSAAAAEAVRAEAAGLLDSMARGRPPSLWQPASSLQTGEGGLLGPAASYLGLPVSRTAVWGLVAGAIGSLAAAFFISRMRSDEAPSSPPLTASPRRRGIVIAATLGLVVLGATLRIQAAGRAPRDGDETWALRDRHSIVTGDHDAWVHPPVFRAIQQRWADAADVRDGGSLLAMRGVSLFCAIATLVLLAAFAAATRSPWALAPLAVVAIAPGIVREDILARPYSLASFAVTLAGALAWWPRVEKEPLDRALRVLAALLATGLAMWTDLLAGLVAGLMCVSLLARERPRAQVSLGIALLFAGAIWAAPLAPGALQAIRHQVHPSAHVSSDSISDETPSPGPDLRPRGGRGRLGSSILTFGAMGLSREASHHGWLVLLGAGLLGAPAWRLRRSSRLALALALITAVLLLLELGGAVELRPRNYLFLPHLAALTWMVVLSNNSTSFPRRPPSAP
jgi:hypothetical protein